MADVVAGDSGVLDRWGYALALDCDFEPAPEIPTLSGAALAFFALLLGVASLLLLRRRGQALKTQEPRT